VEKKGGVITVKTYWPGGIGFESDQPNSDTGTKLYWTHADRLGSPVAITDSSGNFAEKLEYDPWGKRRSTTNHDATPDSLDGKVDNKGFTHHEMLDQLDLVHMNGRVYDPLTGRFLSGDPFIQDPKDGQNYNRYSYVLNNPTNLTDPTGFIAISCTGSRIPGSCGGNNVKLADGYPQRGDGDNSRNDGSQKGNGQTTDSSGATKANAKQPSSADVLFTKFNAAHGAAEDATSSDPTEETDRGEQYAAVRTDLANGGGGTGIGAPPPTAVNTGNVMRAPVRGNARTSSEIAEAGEGSGEGSGGNALQAAPAAPTLNAGTLRPFGTGRPPHTAKVTVTRDGKVVSESTVQSGNMTPSEAALGFPRSSLSTHTEARAARGNNLQKGDTMTIQGQYRPCPSCKGYMNRAARDSGATIRYEWDGNVWEAGGGR
jgi:RHS repeat-associated protein